MIRSPLGKGLSKIIHEPMRTVMKRNQFLCITAAAAFVSGSQAWVLPAASVTTTTRGFVTLSRSHLHQQDPNVLFSDRFVHGPPSMPQHRRRDTATRLFSSNNKDEGFLSKIGNTVKSFLPTRLFGSNEEKQELARKKEYRDQVSGSLDSVLKDAPLGLRMMGKMITPLVSSMASSFADTMAEQQRTMEEVMDDARGYLMSDPAVTGLLGEPISMGTPYSQSSSTTNINGKTQSRVELAMPVYGSRGSGTVQLLATQDGISQMQLDAEGRRVNVSLSKAKSSFRGSSFDRVNGDDNVIEAEVIDKETK